ncbi:MAG: DegT/DnrJ/EryC1/StrS family aminotransferase [bacterium]|nr:DegT/DnrJ/EryC1/StrS family aminotransferase [bacterium]
MKVKIPVGDFKLEKDEKEAILEVLELGRISEGKKTKEFEKRFAEYIDTKYCIALSSGTAALIAGLTALLYDERFKKVKKGSKIITSPVTYVATSNAIIVSGFEPVYVDIDPNTFAIIPDKIEELLKNTNPDEYSIILPVHLMGYPNDMEQINNIATKYNLVVVEDSAQAHGSMYNGKKTGGLSLFGMFSFYIAHNIQAGEMGAITTNDEKIVKLVRKIKANGRLCDCSVCVRNQGKCPYLDKDFDPRFTHQFIGYNFKTMEFQSALGITQLKKANGIFKNRQKNVKYLNKKLERYKNKFQLPLYLKNVSYLAYPIVIKNDKKINREKLMYEFERHGVETRPLFGCIPTQQPAYSYLKEKYNDKLPNADYIGKMGFYIGCHQYLNTENLDYICSTFNNVLSK